jgi:RNA polymerase-binding transcription factor DksA
MARFGSVLNAEKSMTAKQRFCEICKAEISPERIEALPDTRRCTSCARSQEAKGNPEFDLLISQSQLGKAGSLKKNYGDVTVQKRRR